MGSNADELTRRLARLERTMQLWKGSACVLLVMLSAVALLGVAPGQSQLFTAHTIQAQEIELVDGNGLLRARLATSENEVALVFTDANRKPVLFVGVTKEESGVSLMDAGRSRLMLSNGIRGTAIDFFDDKEMPRIEVSMRNGKPMLSVLKPGLSGIVWSVPEQPTPRKR